MLCFKPLKRNCLKLTFSLLTAFLILLGSFGHADADTFHLPIIISGSDGTYSIGSEYNDIITGAGIVASYSLHNGLYPTSSSTCYSAGYGYSMPPLISFDTYHCPEVGDKWIQMDGASSTIIVSSYFDGENYFSSGIYGCMDNMAVNYDPTANIDTGACYYVLPDEVATSTHIINFSYSTTTNKLDISYYVATSSSIQLYTENRNERDGVINSAFSTTTTGLTELNNIPVTLPNPLSGAGYTYLTAKLVLETDHSIVYDWHTLTIDLENGVNLGGGGYQQMDCGITNLGGCFVNGLAVMFYPSQSAFNNFNTFVELIKTKPPVGYFYVVKNNLDNLSSTSTSAFTVTIPNHIKEYLFTPFDVAVGGILWFYFAINFYKRLKHITV